MGFEVRRKKQMLEAIEKHGPQTPHSIINHVNIRHNNAQRLLLYYYKQGLLRRERFGREYRYILSSAGIQRLDYLRKITKER